MAIINTCTRLPGIEHNDDTKQRSYRIKFLIEADSINTAPSALMTAAESASPHNLPGLRDEWEYGEDEDDSSFCIRRSLKQDKQKRDHWECVCEFGQLPPGTYPNQPDNPLNRQPIYWIEHVTYTEDVEKDRDGKPVVNSANQQFNEPVERDVSRMVLTVEKNFSSVQAIINLNRAHALTVNAGNFYGAGSGECLCRPIQCSRRQVEEGVQFWTATFRIEFNPDTWTKTVLNCGFKHYDNENDKNLVQATDINGIPVCEPVLLKNNGTREDDGVEANNTHMLDFELYKSSNFNLLGI